MKELMGGAWIAALVAGALGLWWGALGLGILGAVAGAASWYDEQLKERQAASWRKSYPSYKY